MSYSQINGVGRQSASTSSNVLRTVNDRIERAEVIGKESITIATEALGELAQQRETLIRTRDGVNAANRELDSTNSNLKSMHRRIATNKFLLGAIIFMELVIIGCQLYIKFLK